MIITETLSVQDARVRLPSIVERSWAGDRTPVALGAHGRAEAALMPARLFSELTTATRPPPVDTPPADPLVAAAAALRIVRTTLGVPVDLSQATFLRRFRGDFSL